MCEVCMDSLHTVKISKVFSKHLFILSLNIQLFTKLRVVRLWNGCRKFTQEAEKRVNKKKRRSLWNMIQTQISKDPFTGYRLLGNRFISCHHLILANTVTGNNLGPVLTGSVLWAQWWANQACLDWINYLSLIVIQRRTTIITQCTHQELTDELSSHSPLPPHLWSPQASFYSFAFCTVNIETRLK